MLLHPQREWYLSDMAAHLGVRPSSLQRTLAAFTRATILQRRVNGNRVYYRAEPTCPILGELTGILTKTVGIAAPLQNALAPFCDQIRVAFIHGSVAEGREQADSDVDLIIVGEVPNSDLAFALRSAREKLSREVNFTRYTPKEFAAKVKNGHHFLTSVLDKPRIFLVGGEHELAEAAGRQTFKSLEAADPTFAKAAANFDAARDKRNDFSYDSPVEISDTDADDLVESVKRFHGEIEKWIAVRNSSLV